MLPVILFIGTIVGISACAVKASGQEQGIEGNVYRISGNRMPSPNQALPAPPPFSTDIYIFSVANIGQVRRQAQSPFYYSINTTLVKQVKSDSNGHFSVHLPPGRYSLFTKRDTLFYANWFDKDNNIAPITVLAGKMTKTDIRVDYDAAY